MLSNCTKVQLNTQTGNGVHTIQAMHHSGGLLGDQVCDLLWQGGIDST